MKEYYYYFRDEYKHPIITICLIQKGNGTCARGIAITSKQDNACKKVGRSIAKGRAIQALVRFSSSGKIVTGRALDVLLNVSVYDFQYKSEFQPVLNSYERKLVGDV